MIGGTLPTTNEDLEWDALVKILFSDSVPSPSEFPLRQEEVFLTEELMKSQESLNSVTNNEERKANSSHKKERCLDKEFTEKSVAGKRTRELDGSILLKPCASLTPEQKRQRKLIMNKDAAQRSRDRHKQYVSELESTVTNLKEENKQLKESNQALLKELAMLKEQLTGNEAMTVNIVTNSRQILMSYEEQLQRDGLRRSTSSVTVIPTLSQKFNF